MLKNWTLRRNNGLHCNYSLNDNSLFKLIMLWHNDYMVNLNISHSKSCVLYYFCFLWHRRWLYASLFITILDLIIVYYIID